MNKLDYQIFNLGDVNLLSGYVLKSAKLAYKTYGILNSKKDNVILLPTFFTGTHDRNQGYIGEDRAINPNKYFVISINMFGNGLSTSPSNATQEQKGPKFPYVAMWDNIFCQNRLLKEKFDIDSIALIFGWSMAGCQAYQWAAQYPNTVKSILPVCASAKTSAHNFVFLEGVKAALCADHEWANGNYNKPPEKGLKAFARVYAGWAFSQTFYRESKFKEIGYSSIEELLIDWEEDHVKNWDANNLLTKLKTWQLADISSGPIYNNNYVKALNSIKAKTILLPCNQDLYFQTADNLFEAKNIPNAEIYPYNSDFGHCVANPGNDQNFENKLDEYITKLLN